MTTEENPGIAIITTDIYILQYLQEDRKGHRGQEKHKYFKRSSVHTVCALPIRRAEKNFFLTTLFTDGVSPQCELSNVSANEMIGKTTSCTGDRNEVSHQYELSNVSANEMIGKTTLYTGGR